MGHVNTQGVGKVHFWECNDYINKRRGNKKVDATCDIHTGKNNHYLFECRKKRGKNGV